MTVMERARVLPGGSREPPKDMKKRAGIRKGGGGAKTLSRRRERV